MAMGLQYALRAHRPDGGRHQPGRHLRAHRSLRSTRPDVQFHVATLSSDMAGSKVHTFSGFTMSVCQLRPESRGYVRIKSPDPLAAPAMQPNYLSTESDRATLVAGIRLARALAATRALSPYVAGEYRPGPEATSDDALLEFAKNTAGTIFHPSGTCKMGPAADPLAVVDHDLKVRGLEGIRVVDCSIMPTLVSGNTNAPAVMIAEKIADRMLAAGAR